LLASDLVVLSALVIISYFLRTGPLQQLLEVRIQPLGDYIEPGIVVVVLCVITLAFGRLYEDRRYLSQLERYAQIGKAMVYAIGFVLALSFFTKASEYSRSLIIIFGVLGVAGLIVSRAFWHRVFKSFRKRGWDRLVCAVVGTRQGFTEVRKVLRDYPELGYKPVSWIDAGQGAKAGLRMLDKLFGAGQISAVVVGVPGRHYHQALPYLAWCEEHYLPHHLLSASFDVMHEDDSASSEYPQVEPKPFYSVAKRVIDEALALTAMVISMPVWAIIAVAIRLESPGPVLFVQDRVGRHGRLFRLYKFRTMYAHSPKYAITPRSGNDPRVTKIGWFLRKTSLDELPQLLNILRGEMSLVGPRPEMPFMLNKYTPRHRQRLMVLPGLTGLWQAIARHTPLEQSIRYDLYYLKNRSLLFDLMIIGRTFFSVLVGRGAY